jgi:hypothetical protein
MKSLRHILLPALLILLTAAFTSCEHKDLCYVHPHSTRVKVVFDWMNAPEANPESMVLYLFPTEGGAPEIFEFVGRDGGYIDVTPGSYTAMCLNSSTENLAYNTLRQHSEYYEDCDLYEVSTGTTELLSRFASNVYISKAAATMAPRADGTDDQRIVLEPDSIWSDSTRPVDLSYVAGDTKVITLYPEQAFCHYTVKILHVDNADQVSGITAALSGQAGGFYPTARRLTEETVTIPFEMHLHAAEATVDGDLRTFGHNPTGGDDQSHLITVYATMRNGAKYYMTYDVTEQIHSAANPRELLIVIDNLALPEAIGDSGFGPVVDEWQDDEVVDILMNDYL